MHPDAEVYIKPSSHKTYWQGPALYIPKEMYDWKVRDIALRRRDEEEPFRLGSISLFVDFDEYYDRISDREELEDINNYYKQDTREDTRFAV